MQKENYKHGKIYRMDIEMSGLIKLLLCRLEIENGVVIQLYNVLLHVNPIIRKIWTEKKEYAQYGWMLPPSPETHDLHYIHEGIDVFGETNILDEVVIDELMKPCKIKFQLENIEYQINVVIKSYEYDSMNGYKITFQNTDRKLESKEIKSKINE